MKLLRCPINGWRPLSEFVYGGEVRPMPDPTAASDREWAEYVFCRQGEPGVLREWWYHVPSGTWLVAERDTLKDEVRATWLWPPPDAAQPSPDIPHTETAAASAPAVEAVPDVEMARAAQSAPPVKPAPSGEVARPGEHVPTAEATSAVPRHAETPSQPAMQPEGGPEARA